MENAINYSAELAEIVTNQHEQIELLQEQNAILMEQINGFSIISNYLNGFLGIAVGLICVKLLWTVLSKWFFRGC